MKQVNTLLQQQSFTTSFDLNFANDFASFEQAQLQTMQASGDLHASFTNPLAPTWSANTLSLISPPSTPDLNAGSDSSWLGMYGGNSDNITNITTPLFNGTAAANSKVELYDGVNFLGASLSDAKGQWHIKSAQLSNGTHLINATVTDVNGQRSAPSDSLKVLIDTVAPLANGVVLAVSSDSGISNSDNITNAQNLVFYGFAEPGNLITLQDSGSAIRTTIALPNGKWAFDGVSLAEGKHVINIKETDWAGNQSYTSKDLLLTIDRTAPTAPTNLTLLTDSGAPDNITNSPIQAFSVTPPSDAAKVSLYEGGVWLKDFNFNGSKWLVDGIVLSEGKHTVNAVAMDLAGNVSNSSLDLNVLILKSSFAPALAHDSAAVADIAPLTLVGVTHASDVHAIVAA